jgi:Uma2 family endonuclease
MNAMVMDPPTVKQQTVSYEDYLAQASESRIMEWVDGEVITYMPASDRHQDISRFLTTILDTFVTFFKLGFLRYAPFEVKLWPNGPSREPDILFISQEQAEQLQTQRFVGGPALIIEIISPSSVTADRVDKFSEYEQAGVEEYWLIDSRPYQQQADFYRLQDGKFEAVPLTEEGIFYSVILPHFWLNPAWLTAETLPNPQLILSEIMLTVPDLSPDAREAYEALRRVLQSD